MLELSRVHRRSLRSRRGEFQFVGRHGGYCPVILDRLESERKGMAEASFAPSQILQYFWEYAVWNWG
jgi:hypothetical protein